jgi:hypothetical protein
VPDSHKVRPTLLRKMFASESTRTYGADSTRGKLTTRNLEHTRRVEQNHYMLGSIAQDTKDYRKMWTSRLRSQRQLQRAGAAGESAPAHVPRRPPAAARTSDGRSSDDASDEEGDASTASEPGTASDEESDANSSTASSSTGPVVASWDYPGDLLRVVADQQGSRKRKNWQEFKNENSERCRVLGSLTPLAIAETFKNKTRAAAKMSAREFASPTRVRAVTSTASTSTSATTAAAPERPSSSRRQLYKEPVRPLAAPEKSDYSAPERRDYRELGYGVKVWTRAKGVHILGQGEEAKRLQKAAWAAVVKAAAEAAAVEAAAEAASTEGEEGEEEEEGEALEEEKDVEAEAAATEGEEGEKEGEEDAASEEEEEWEEEEEEDGEECVGGGGVCRRRRRRRRTTKRRRRKRRAPRRRRRRRTSIHRTQWGRNAKER